MGGNFKFQVQDIFLEYLFWRFEKRNAFSEEKPSLVLKVRKYLEKSYLYENQNENQKRL